MRKSPLEVQSLDASDSSDVQDNPLNHELFKIYEFYDINIGNFLGKPTVVNIISTTVRKIEIHVFPSHNFLTGV